MSAQRERPTQNLAVRTKLERVGQGVGGGRAERRVADTVTGRKQFFYFPALEQTIFIFFAIRFATHYSTPNDFLLTAIYTRADAGHRVAARVYL